MDVKLIVFVFGIFCAKIFKCDVLPMIDSLVHEYSFGPVITAFLCNKNDSIMTLKHFSKKMIQVNILPVETYDLPYPIPSSRVMFFLDLKCRGAQELLTRANNESFFADPFKWIIYHDRPSTIENLIETYFKPLNLLVDSDVTVAVKEDQEAFNLRKIYKRHINSSITIEEIGTWSAQGGFISSGYEKVTYKRRRNLMKTILNTCIVITHNETLQHLTDKRDRHIDSITKVNYVLVEHLSDTINATLNYSITSTWGYLDNASQWSGMIGELTRKEADIGGTALFFTSDRIKIIDYIAMTTLSRSKFIFRQPKLSYVANVFTLPFSGFVWASTCALVAITAVIFYVTVKWEWKKKDHAEIPNSWTETAFITFGAFCQQGSPSTPFSLPARITFIFLLVSFMFLYTSYAANIVALLQSSSNSIKNLKDLLHSRLDVGVHDTVFNRFYFPHAMEPTRQAIYSQKVAPPGQKPKYYTIEEGINRMRQGLFAFHVEEGPGYKFVSETFQEDEKCDLEGIQFLQVPDPWLAIQKNSTYKKMLKVGLRLLQENGIQSREIGLIYMKKPECLGRSSTFISVSLVDCYPAAVVLAGGIGAAILVFLLEIYVNMRLKHWVAKAEKMKKLLHN